MSPTSSIARLRALSVAVMRICPRVASSAIAAVRSVAKKAMIASGNNAALKIRKTLAPVGMLPKRSDKARAAGVSPTN